MAFYTFLPKILNMSLTASVAIVFVLLLRLLLKKAPKVISYALWSVVLIRLLCPVSIESGLSLFSLFDTPTVDMTEHSSAVEYIPSNIVHTEFPEVVLPVPGVGEAITEVLPQGEEQLRADPLEGPIFIATYVWWGGILVMAIYGIVTYLRLRRRLITASPLRDNIYLADDIDSPFVMGLFRPKIYLPSAMEEREQSYILLHEQHHIRRLDHVVKAVAFVALCIHWFNPLVWVAFILSGKDMEMSCDEAVVRKLGTQIRADYTASLLSLATGKRIIAGMPLAFGEGNTKGRIKNLANWKKPAFWVVMVAVVACVALAVCLLTNPKQDSYKLRIVVPAGSMDEIIYQEDFVYSDEEISPIGNKITISSGEGLGDTEVVLKPIQVKEENAYEPTYLTPGMPVEMDVEKGAWFKVGVNVQNPTDEDIFVYVEVKGVEVRISDESTPDRITFEAEVLEFYDGYILVKPEPSWAFNSADQIEVPMKNMDPALEPQVGDIIEISYGGEILETYPARLKEVYSIRVVAETTKLTLDDVIILSQYGYDLSWSDFENYDYIETGSGLYIRIYEINEMYELWIGGGGPDSDPMYIYLALANDLDTRIDIRDGGVTEFISEYGNLDPAYHPEGILHLGLNAEIVDIDASNHILYVKDINESADVFGERCAINCNYAISRFNLLYANYNDANDVRTIGFSDFQVGDAIIIGLYDSEKENAFNGAAVAEQIQLGTQRLSSIRALSQEEIDQVNAMFAPIVYDKQGNPISTNVWSCFFTSYYSDVRNMNFAEFLAYFPGDGSTVDEEEFAVLKEHPDFLFYGEVSTLANMPVPVHRYPVRIIDLVLKEYAGITVDELDTSGVVYLAEYDAFYNHTSDAGGGMFYCTRGEIDGDIVRLYEEFDYGTDMLTLKKVGNNYQIVAHQHVEG